MEEEEEGAEEKEPKKYLLSTDSSFQSPNPEHAINSIINLLQNKTHHLNVKINIKEILKYLIFYGLEKSDLNDFLMKNYVEDKFRYKLLKVVVETSSKLEICRYKKEIIKFLMEKEKFLVKQSQKEEGQDQAQNQENKDQLSTIYEILSLFLIKFGISASFEILNFNDSLDLINLYKTENKFLLDFLLVLGATTDVKRFSYETLKCQKW